MRILLKNVSFVLLNPKKIVKDFDILIEDQKIAKVKKRIDEKVEKKIDCRNKLVMPGLINSHTHLPMILFRGIAEDLPLMKWLKENIWPLEVKLKSKHVYLGTLMGCIELIKNGITCFGDMYFFGESIAKAVKESGLRALVSCVFLDLLPERMGGINTALKTLKKIRRLKCERVQPWLGPHAIYSCSKETLEFVREISEKENLRINIHLSETKEEIKISLGKYGKRPVEFLESISFLNPKVTAAHCIHLTKKEIDILAKRRVKVVYNPTSNLKVCAGIAPISEIKNKICVALGTDGAASNNSLDIFREMKFASLIQKIRTYDPSAISAKDVLEFSTINGAKALGLDVGEIKEGKSADLIILDLKDISLRPITTKDSVINNIVYSTTGNSVETVIVNGEIVMENRKIRTLDEEKIVKRAESLVKSLLRL